MKSDPEGLSVLKMITAHADARKGLTAKEADELLADKTAWENATITPKEEDNHGTRDNT